MRLARAILIAGLLLAVAAAPSAGRPTGGVVARVINGTPVADTADWPSIAYLSVGCTGSLIADRIVLTAAHCVFNSSNNVISPVGRTARVGVLDRGAAGAIGWSAIAVHPEYDPARTAAPYDVALITLASAPGKPTMPIVSPWQDAFVTDGVVAEVAGWGSITPSGPFIYPSDLREAAIPTFGNAYCGSVHGTLFDAATMICAGDLANGIDTCFGDSGGPLALRIGDVKTLIGDTSWGPDPCANPVRPGVYGRMSAFRPWLAEQLDVVPPAPVITAITNTGPDLTIVWAEPTGDSAWAALSFDASDGSATTTVAAPTLSASLPRATGGTVSVTVTARNPARSSSSTWSGTPTPTRAPVVTARVDAVPRVDALLTASGTSDDPWGQAPVYEWRVGGALVQQGAATTYRPTAAQAGKLVTLTVLAANAAGTGSATVNVGRVSRGPQVARGLIRVTGAARVGGRLRARLPVVSGYPAPTPTYRWFRDGRRVRSATGAVYRVRPVDAGARITGRVTWTNAIGRVTRTLRPVMITG